MYFLNIVKKLQKLENIASLKTRHRTPLRVGDRGESPTWPDTTVRDLSNFGRSDGPDTGSAGCGDSTEWGRNREQGTGQAQHSKNSPPGLLRFALQKRENELRKKTQYELGLRGDE